MNARLRNSKDSVCRRVLATVALACTATIALGAEALGDLDVRATLVQVVPGRKADSIPTGVARVDLTLQAAHLTRDIALRVEAPDGRVWTVRSAAFRPEVAWTTPGGGEPYEAGDGSTAIPARGTLRATLDVPLAGAAVHEMIFKVSGVGPNGPVSGEAMVRAALGVVENLPVDDGETASFPLESTP